MDRESPFGWENRANVEWWADYKFIVILSSAGLLSGLIVNGLSYPVGKLHRDPALFLYGAGAVFGVTMAAALAIRRILRIWGVILLPGAAAIAHCLSLYLGFFVQAAVGLPNPGSISPVALFAAGLLGGSLVLGSILLSVGMDVVEALALALLWSPIAGVLGVIGWTLGPSLGMAIWSGNHALSLTPPTESFQNALLSDECHFLSLYVLWQSGIGLVSGFMLKRYAPELLSKVNLRS